MLTPHEALLENDTSRVVARFSLPGGGLALSNSRIAQIVARVLSTPTETVEATAAAVQSDLRAQAGRRGSRHDRERPGRRQPPAARSCA